MEHRPTLHVRDEVGRLLSEAEMEDVREGLGGRDGLLRLRDPPTSTGTRLTMALLALLALAAIVLGGGAAVAPALLFLVAAGTVLQARGSAELGEDGMHIRGLLCERFVPWHDVRRVDVGPRVTQLRLRSGEHIDVWSRGRGTSAAALEAGREALRARRVLAREAWDRAMETGLASRLRRGARPLGDWRAELEAMRPHDAYRGAPYAEDDLSRVVECAEAPADARAAAAVVLRTTCGAGPRLRVIAGEVAQPELRAALEHAADPNAAVELDAVRER